MNRLFFIYFGTFVLKTKLSNLSAGKVNTRKMNEYLHGFKLSISLRTFLFFNCI